MATVAELKAQAKAKGLKGYSKMRKAELEKLVGNGKKKASPSKGASPKAKLDPDVIESKIMNDLGFAEDVKDVENDEAEDEDDVDRYNAKVFKRLGKVIKNMIKKNNYKNDTDAAKKIHSTMDKDMILKYH